MSETYAAGPDLAAKAKDVVRDVKAKAADLTDGVTRTAKENASQLGEAAVSVASSAKGKVEGAVTERKSLGADYMELLAQATSRAANEFELELPQPHTTSGKQLSRSRVSRTLCGKRTYAN